MVKSKVLLVLYVSSYLFLPLIIIGNVAYGSETLPWGVDRIHAQCVWDNDGNMSLDQGANAGQGVRVAIIDSGVDYWTDQQGNIYYHPDLQGNIAGGKGFFYHWQTDKVEETDDYKDPDDPEDQTYWGGHGTEVAGIIAAVDNDVGLIGVSPKVQIYVAKLVTRRPQEVVAAIGWAIAQDVQVISMSFGYADDYPGLWSACVDAYYLHGISIVAASGNDNTENRIDYPAAYDFVIAVGAINRVDERWVNSSSGQGSDYGPALDFVAPGVDIESTGLDGSYATCTGTSFACPHVTGVAALVYASKNTFVPEAWTNTQVESVLIDFAFDLGPRGKDMEYGWGLIDGWASLQRPLYDVNNDLHVDVADIAIVSAAFGSRPGNPKWDPRADVNLDNRVDIQDLARVSWAFGTVDP